MDRPMVARRRFIIAATLILLLAAGLRLFWLADVPPGLSQDEVLDADIVSLIWQGRLPLFFREGYGHEPLYHYWAALFRPFLGDNVLAVRLPSVSLGLLLVAATMRWARRDFSQVAAIACGVGLAISWWPIIFSRIGIRPIALPLLLVAAAWFWPRRPWLAGLCLGLSLYTYTAARVVFLIPLLFGLYLLLREQAASGKWQVASPRFTFHVSRLQRPIVVLRRPMLILIIALLIYLPLAFTLWADPTLQQRVEQLSGPLEALQAGDARPILRTTLATLGVFSFTGDPRWTYTLPGRPLFDPFSALLCYGGLLLALWRLRQPRYAFILIWLGVGLLPSAITPDAPSTIRMVGAMPVVYLMPALAVSWLWQRISKQYSVSSKQYQPLLTAYFLLSIGLLLAGYNLIRTVENGFLRWPAAQETRFRYQTVLLEMARLWESAPADALVITDSFYEPIDHDSFRRDLGRPLAVRWVEAGRAAVFPVGSDATRFYVPEFAPVAPELIDAAGLGEPLYRSEGDPSFAAYELPDEPRRPAANQAVTWGGALTLLGYELGPRRPGEPLQLLTYWRVERPLPRDLTIFVHLLDESGAIGSQHDSLDVAPATLQLGDRFIQLHSVPPPAAGVYQLQIGVYTLGDGQRWLLDGVGADHLVLEERVVFDE